MTTNFSNALGVSIAAAASYMLYHSVSEYGWNGTIMLIWEGDPYTEQAREYLEILDSATRIQERQELEINIIEEALERARLDSVDDKDSISTKELWANYYPSHLEKVLVGMSDKLDKVAAKVDGVLLSSRLDSAPQVFQKIRQKKKLLSKQLVLNMERCDALMASYEILQGKT
jgi:hypothetical protein